MPRFDVVWPLPGRAYGVQGGSLLVHTDVQAWWYAQMVRGTDWGQPDLDGLADLVRGRKRRSSE